MDKFWMVFVEGTGGPAKKHTNLQTAKDEAERLCRKSREPVFVLEVVESCSLGDVIWRRPDVPRL